MAAVALEGIEAEAALEDTVAGAQQGFGLVEADMDPVDKKYVVLNSYKI